MTCPDCALVRQRHGLWHGYRAGCLDCTARAAARSQAAFDAIRCDRPQDLQELIGRLFPATPYAAARRMVWDWWLLDHPQEEQATTP